MNGNSCDIAFGYGNWSDYKNHDLIVYHYGYEKCKAKHFWTGVRDHYLIHYIISGKGTFIYNDKTYHLEQEQGFLICPNILSYYQADKDQPWEYCWIGFKGRKAKHYLSQLNLSVEQPIFNCQPNNSILFIVKKMIESKNITKGKDWVLTGLAYHFLAEIIQNEKYFNHSQDTKNYSEIYVKKAVDFIEKNYSRKITVEDIADHVGINRKYLSSLFKELMHTSPQSFLINYRMNKACILLAQNLLSISHVAHSVGYDDPLLFSKMFKKYKGMAPSQYRKRLMSQL